MKAPTHDGMTRSELAKLIDEHIFSQRDRYILYRHLLDGATYKEIANEMMENDYIPSENSICKRCLRAKQKLPKQIT